MSAVLATMPPDNITREQAEIRVDGDLLWAELAYGPSDPSFAAVIMNPHPYMGGSSKNTLVIALADAIAAAGGISLRFDYRGIGASEGGRIDVIAGMNEFWRTGHAPEDLAMHEDGIAAIEWMKRATNAPLAIVGYSFGAHVAAINVPADAVALAMISPTLTRHDFSKASPAMRWANSSIPTLAVYSDNDFATPANVVEKWIAQMPRAIESRCVAGGQHFFKGMEEAVAGLTVDFINNSMRATRKAVA